MMKPFLTVFLLCTSFFFTSCYRYGIYQHSMVLNSNPYQAIPLKQDSSKSAIYAGANLIGGYVNHRLNDGTGGIQATIHQGTNFGSFQAHYGVNGSLGFYRAADYGQLNSYYYNPNLNNYLIDSINGTKMFGSVGISAGINTVIPFDNGGEWRIVGLEFTHQYEWDNSYSNFRRKISIQDANVVEHTRHFSTLGLSSEFLLKFNEKENFSYKILGGASLGNLRFYESFTADYQTFRTFLAQYLQYTSGRGTYYLQGSFGYYSISGMLGFNLRLR